MHSLADADACTTWRGGQTLCRTVFLHSVLLFYMSMSISARRRCTLYLHLTTLDVAHAEPDQRAQGMLRAAV